MVCLPNLKEIVELAKICKSVYQGPINHKLLSYRGIYFKEQRIVQGSFNRGFIRLFWNDEYLVIGFRGTRQIMDWVISNLNAFLTYMRGFETTGRNIIVHAGFQNTLYFTDKTTRLPSMDAVYHHIQALDLHHGRKVILTGHSLGGAIALLCFSKLAIHFEEYFKSNSADIVVFGCPAAGLKIFCNYYESLNQRTIRIVNESDPVPFAFPLSFHHVGREYWLDNTEIVAGRGWKERLRSAAKKPLRKIVSDHSMVSYLANLRRISQNSET